MENIPKFEDRHLLYESLIEGLNLQKIKAAYYPHHFGNYEIIFSAGDFLIWYLNDRFQLFIFLSSNSAPDRWLDLVFIKNFINNADEINPDDQEFDIKAIREQNDFLKSNFGKIAELLNKDNYQSTLDQIEALARAEFIRKHPGAVKGY
jgi:hypothetical protein